MTSCKSGIGKSGEVKSLFSFFMFIAKALISKRAMSSRIWFFCNSFRLPLMSCMVDRCIKKRCVVWRLSFERWF